MTTLDERIDERIRALRRDNPGMPYRDALILADEAERPAADEDDTSRTPAPVVLDEAIDRIARRLQERHEGLRYADALILAERQLAGELEEERLLDTAVRSRMRRDGSSYRDALADTERLLMDEGIMRDPETGDTSHVLSAQAGNGAILLACFAE